MDFSMTILSQYTVHSYAYRVCIISLLIEWNNVLSVPTPRKNNGTVIIIWIINCSSHAKVLDYVHKPMMICFMAFLHFVWNEFSCYHPVKYLLLFSFPLIHIVSIFEYSTNQLLLGFVGQYLSTHISAVESARGLQYVNGKTKSGGISL